MPFADEEKGKRVMCPALNESSCGCVKSALLWHDFRVETLVGIRFTLNPYDLCVANSDAKGSQRAIFWHVDDNETSHKSEETLRNMMSQLESKFGPISSKCFGPEHDFLGMKLNLITKKSALVPSIILVR